jgi:hypothetical protein
MRWSLKRFGQGDNGQMPSSHTMIPTVGVEAFGMAAGTDTESLNMIFCHTRLFELKQVDSGQVRMRFG